jgi:hypothetical protein
VYREAAKISFSGRYSCRCERGISGRARNLLSKSGSRIANRQNRPPRRRRETFLSDPPKCRCWVYDWVYGWLDVSAGQMPAPRCRLIISKIIRLTGCSWREAKSAKLHPRKWKAPRLRQLGVCRV